MMRKMDTWLGQTLNSFQTPKKINLSLSILFNLFGFFSGNLCGIVLGSFFAWGWFSALLVLLSIEIIGLVEYNPVNRDNQVFQYFGVFKRGFFFGLLADGFKVGS